jgi:3,4-dihydroxy 2-butanone 4-phosphate synthase/GTP cyclohydrolase II
MAAFREKLEWHRLENGERPPGRPFVTVTFAQSVDGSIAGKHREQLRLSGDASMRLTHHLRACHDAILVGIGTVMADNPRLSVRHVPGTDPQPVVLDTHFRTPEACHLVQRGTRRPWIMGGDASATDKGRTLSGAGAMTTLVPATDDDRVDLPSVLRLLSERGMKSLMVEGGARVITSFVKARLVDQFIITIAPRMVGGLSVFERDAFSEPPLRGFSDMMYRQLGADLVLWATPAWDGP